MNEEPDFINYETMKKKAHHEIQKLKESENSFNSEQAVFDAFNGAFTVYHLLQWREKEINPDSNKKEHVLCEESDNQDIKLLHAIVTRLKHVTCSQPMEPGKKESNVSTEQQGGYIGLQGGGALLKEDGGKFLLEQSKITVYFDMHKAVEALEKALEYILT